jgi:hypothetical protein
MVLGTSPRWPGSSAASVALACVLCGSAAAQAPTPSPAPREDSLSPPPSPSPSASPSPPLRLRLEIERHVEEILEEGEKKGIPRFETRVEVVGKSPQLMLNRFFGGIEYDCTPGGAPPDGGAPTHVEMREARWHPTPTADFEGALLKLLGSVFKSKTAGEERYFLYRVKAKDDVSYLLREGRLPDSVRYATPGTTYELVQGFADPKSGAKALWRLERGFPTPEAPNAPPPADWQTSTCRPR